QPSRVSIAHATPRKNTTPHTRVAKKKAPTFFPPDPSSSSSPQEFLSGFAALSFSPASRPASERASDRSDPARRRFQVSPDLSEMAANAGAGAGGSKIRNAKLVRAPHPRARSPPSPFRFPVP
uniref:Uncharacterized protein n=1 Tax=Triticum urartu TaxID=4572 RepID=A0A8R7Q7Y8_TRIUA